MAQVRWECEFVCVGVCVCVCVSMATGQNRGCDPVSQSIRVSDCVWKHSYSFPLQFDRKKNRDVRIVLLQQNVATPTRNLNPSNNRLAGGGQKRAAPVWYHQTHLSSSSPVSHFVSVSALLKWTFEISWARTADLHCFSGAMLIFN